MSVNVFANGREVSAKKSDNQSIAAMPDVCLTPPSPPVGPIPIPYPNFSQASDTTDGTTSVKIGGDEAGIKDESSYKTSKGDEAATKSLGMGTVSHQIQGKTYFAEWSSDVMFEGSNAVRFMDMTTHNHACKPQNSGSLTKSVASAAPSEPDPGCIKLDNQRKQAVSKTDGAVDYKKVGSEGFTVTSFSYAPPSGPLQIKAPSFKNAISKQQFLKNKNDTSFAPSNTKKTMGCSDQHYGGLRGQKNAVESNMTRNHAEPKIMEPIFQAAGSPTSPTGPASLGILKMKTYHMKSSGVADATPCETCHPAICIAVECGLDIKLCNHNNEAVSPPCNKGQPAPDAQWHALGLGDYL